MQLLTLKKQTIMFYRCYLLKIKERRCGQQILNNELPFVENKSILEKSNITKTKKGRVGV